MNADHWTTAISDDMPCGADLEYDDAFMALGRAVLGKPEQQYGNTVIAAEKPDWREVERLADGLMKRTKDIRVCILLLRALTQNHGLTGLTSGLALLQSLMERYWDELHPQLLVDGEDDPYVRISAIAELANTAGLVRDVRQAILIKSALGPISVKDADAVLESGQSDSGLSRQQLFAIAAQAQREQQPSFLAVAEADHSLGRLITICKERFGEGHAPDLANLSTLLTRLVAGLLQSSSATTDFSDTGFADSSESPVSMAAGHAVDVGCITSRQDVLRVLEAVCRYIEENEPTNPAPLLIKRAQRLMTLDFMEIMMDLAPDSVTQIGLITGVRQYS